MDIFELLRSSLAAIRTNKTRSVLTTLGIIIGVASVILLVSIGTGLQGFVTKQFEELGSNLLLIAPGKVSFNGGGGGPPISAEAKFSFDNVKEVAALGPPITDAMGSIVKPSTAKYLTKTYDVTVAGVGERYSEIRNIKADKGQTISAAMVRRVQPVTMIGPKVAEKLFRSGEDPLGKEIKISNQKLTVIGVAVPRGGLGGGTSDPDSYIYLPVTTAQRIFGIKKPASVAVVVDKPENMGLASTMVKKYFARRGLTEDDYTLLEPKEILAQINTFLGAVTGALSGIAAISLVVGGIGIANIMLVSVTERTREIGLRKALGATRRDILAQFLIEAVVFSALGGVIGIGVGAGLSAIIARFIQTSVSWQSVALAFGVSAAVGIVSGFAPALRASRLDPIEALRYE